MRITPELRAFLYALGFTMLALLVMVSLNCTVKVIQSPEQVVRVDTIPMQMPPRPHPAEEFVEGLRRATPGLRIFGYCIVDSATVDIIYDHRNGIEITKRYRYNWKWHTWVLEGR